jgi:hypothetical protein
VGRDSPGLSLLYTIQMTRKNKFIGPMTASAAAAQANSASRKNAKQPKKQASSSKKAASKEMSILGGALRSLGGLAGGMFGPQGAAVGSGLGASLSKWLGSGDYTLGNNSIVERYRSSGQIPAMHSAGQSIVVRHKEYIGDVLSGVSGPPSTFNVWNSFALNPGLESSFPWLAGIAQQFQEYTWKGLVYEFVSTSGESVASTNTAIGTVMIGTQYRSNAPPFTSKVQMLNEYFSSDAKPSENFCHPIECDPKENPFNVQYIRGAAVPTGDDPKMYDLGTVYIATEGMPNASGTLIGELWASYEVELRKPILASLIDSYNPWFHWFTTTGIVAGSAPLGTINAGVTVNTSNFTCTIQPTIIVFPNGSVGRYLVKVVWSNCTAFTAPAVSTVPSGSVTIISSTFIAGVASQFDSAQYTVGTKAAEVSMIVSIPDASTPNPTIQFGLAGTLTGCTCVDIMVTQVASTAT